MQPDRHGRAARTPPDARRRPDHGFRVTGERRFALLAGDVLASLPEPVASALRGAAVRHVAVPPDPVDGWDVPLVAVVPRRGRPPEVVVHRRALELRATSAPDLADLLRTAVVHAAADALGLELGPEWDDPDA